MKSDLGQKYRATSSGEICHGAFYQLYYKSSGSKISNDTGPGKKVWKYDTGRQMWRRLMNCWRSLACSRVAKCPRFCFVQYLHQIGFFGGHGNLAEFSMEQSRKTLQICRIYSGKILSDGVRYFRTIFVIPKIQCINSINIIQI